MIALMRKLINNNVYKIFLWVFLFMMATGSGLVFFREDRKDWVIKVYDRKMFEQKFNVSLQQVKQQQDMFRQRGYPLPKSNLYKDTIDVSVTKLLIENAANKLGLMVKQSHVDQEVQRQFQGLPAEFFKENGMLNIDELLRAIAPNTLEGLIADIEVDIKNKLLYGLLDASIYVSKFELDMYRNAEYADKKYSYFVLSYQKYLTKARQEPVTTEELQKFYKKQDVADTFKTTERRSGQKWVFDQSSYSASVSQAETKSFYEKNKMNLYVATPAQMQVRRLMIAVEPSKEQEAKAKIEEIKKEADKDTENFEFLVKKFSDDKSAATHGGLSELFTKDDKKLNKVIVDTAFEFLGADGQISVPVKTDRGYELIQRVKKVPAKYKDYASVENEIKHQLGAEKFKKRFAQDAGRVVQEARYNPEAIKSFVSRYKGVKVELPMTTRDSNTDDTHLFRLEEGRFTHYFDKDKGVILTCQKIERSVIPPFDQVSTKVKDMYFEQKADGQVKDLLNQALKDAQSMPFDKVAEKYDANIQEASFKYNGGKPEQSAILKEPGIKSKLKSLQYQGSVLGAQAASNGVLLKLNAISPISDTLTNLEAQEIMQVLFYTKAYQSKEGFVASLCRIAKLNNEIEIKSEILQRTKEV